MATAIPIADRLAVGMLARSVTFAITTLFFIGSRVNAQQAAPLQVAVPANNTGFLDFNIYPYTDVDSDNAATINALANLPKGFQYFSLTNFGRDPRRDELEEFDTLLTEQNLRWQLPGGIPVMMAAQA